MNIICVEWKTEHMPVPAFEYYHAACYQATSPIWPNASTREVTYAAGTCAGCGEPISETQPVEREIAHA